MGLGIRRVRLAFTDALDLRRMQAVNFLAHLLLPLVQHPARQVQGPQEIACRSSSPAICRPMSRMVRPS